MRVLDLSYHPLDVRSGRWVDLSRKGNHGTPYGGARPYMIAPGVMGFEFDGSNGYVACKYDRSLHFGVGESFTVSVWFKTDDTSHNQELVASNTAAQPSYILFLGTNLRLYWRLDDGPNLLNLQGSSNPFDDKWHNLVGTYNADTDIGEMYFDANLDASGKKALGSLVTTHDIWIGHTAYYFNGLIAQPIIENRAWSEAEVRENMYRSPIYRVLRGLPHSWIYTKVPWKQQGGIYVP